MKNIYTPKKSLLDYFDGQQEANETKLSTMIAFAMFGESRHLAILSHASKAGGGGGDFSSYRWVGTPLFSSLFRLETESCDQERRNVVQKFQFLITHFNFR